MTIAEYGSRVLSDNASNPLYGVINVKHLPPPVIQCHTTRGIPCPPDKSSYWRSFATDVKDGSCPPPKRICGAQQWPMTGPPQFVVHPASRGDLIKFL